MNILFPTGWSIARLQCTKEVAGEQASMRGVGGHIGIDCVGKEAIYMRPPKKITKCFRVYDQSYAIARKNFSPENT